MGMMLDDIIVPESPESPQSPKTPEPREERTGFFRRAVGRLSFGASGGTPVKQRSFAQEAPVRMRAHNSDVPRVPADRATIYDNNVEEDASEDGFKERDYFAQYATSTPVSSNARVEMREAFSSRDEHSRRSFDARPRMGVSSVLKNGGAYSTQQQAPLVSKHDL